MLTKVNYLNKLICLDGWFIDGYALREFDFLKFVFDK